MTKKSNKHHERGDCLLEDFKNRFEKFHRIKEDPFPIVNGWMSLYMLKELDSGYNRLSFYLQKPVKVNFFDFSSNKVEFQLENNNKVEDIKEFIFEVASRALNLPLNIQRCELNINKCEYMN